ncbi:hypothetical protein MKX03_021797 [Papaver bracteatum]|nr:hypothetical protein MKX03_021797 [Papaver bracteatum]
MASLSSIVSLYSPLVHTRSLKNVALGPIHQIGRVVLQKVTPKFNPPFQGFTKTLKTLNPFALEIVT